MGRPKGASISDVNLSQNGELPYQPFQNVVINAHELGQDEPRPDSEWVIFKLKGKRNGRLYIHGEDEVYNVEKESLQRLVCLKGEGEVWWHKLEGKYKLEDISKLRRTDLFFEGGVLRIAKHDKGAVDFLRNSRNCTDVKNRKVAGRHDYFEYNPQKQAEELQRKTMQGVSAMRELFQLGEEKLRKIALFEGIPFNDELGESKSLMQIQNDLALRASNNPERFLNLLEDPSVEISFLIARAIKDSKIEINRDLGKIHYSQGGGFIMSYPTNKNPKNCLVDFATSKTKDANEFLENLKQLVK
jgi:hypothetical protein